MDTTNTNCVLRQSILAKLRSWPEVPGICHFCSLFRDEFNLPHFEIEEFEDALYLEEENTNSTFIRELIIRLLKGCYPKRMIDDVSWPKYLYLVFRNRWKGEVCPVTDDTAETFRECDLYQKVSTLQNLCDLRMDCEDMSEVKLDASCMRIEPLGENSDGHLFWYFYGVRLYKETPANPFLPDKQTPAKSKASTGKKRKHSLAKSRKRKMNLRGSAVEEESEETEDVDAPPQSVATDKWELVCSTLDDWVNVSESLQESSAPCEVSLRQLIDDKFLPEMPKLLADKAREIRKRQEMMGPRRQSERLEVKKLSVVDQAGLEAVRFQEDSLRMEREEESEQYKKRLEERTRRLALRNKEKEREGINREREQNRQRLLRTRRAEYRERRLACLATGEELPAEMQCESPLINVMSLETEQVLIGIITKMRKSSEAWPFQEPVDRNVVPDYYDIVSNPMDLQMIENKLDSGSYICKEDVVADFELMTSNCELYNGSRNEYTIMGKKLLKLFDTAMCRNFPNYKMPKRTKRVSVPMYTNSDWVVESTMKSKLKTGVKKAKEDLSKRRKRNRFSLNMSQSCKKWDYQTRDTAVGVASDNLKNIKDEFRRKPESPHLQNPHTPECVPEQSSTSMVAVASRLTALAASAKKEGHSKPLTFGEQVYYPTSSRLKYTGVLKKDRNRDPAVQSRMDGSPSQIKVAAIPGQSSTKVDTQPQPVKSEPPLSVGAGSPPRVSAINGGLDKANLTPSVVADPTNGDSKVDDVKLHSGADQPNFPTHAGSLSVHSTIRTSAPPGVGSAALSPRKLVINNEMKQHLKNCSLQDLLSMKHVLVQTPEFSSAIQIPISFISEASHPFYFERGGKKFRVDLPQNMITKAKVANYLQMHQKLKSEEHTWDAPTPSASIRPEVQSSIRPEVQANIRLGVQQAIIRPGVPAGIRPEVQAGVRPELQIGSRNSIPLVHTVTANSHPLVHTGPINSTVIIPPTYNTYNMPLLQTRIASDPPAIPPLTMINGPTVLPSNTPFDVPGGIVGPTYSVSYAVDPNVAKMDKSNVGAVAHPGIESGGSTSYTYVVSSPIVCAGLDGSTPQHSNSKNFDSLLFAANRLLTPKIRPSPETPGPAGDVKPTSEVRLSANETVDGHSVAFSGLNSVSLTNGLDEVRELSVPAIREPSPATERLVTGVSVPESGNFVNVNNSVSAKHVHPASSCETIELNGYVNGQTWGENLNDNQRAVSPSTSLTEKSLTSFSLTNHGVGSL